MAVILVTASSTLKRRETLCLPWLLTMLHKYFKAVFLEEITLAFWLFSGRLSRLGLHVAVLSLCLSAGHSASLSRVNDADATASLSKPCARSAFPQGPGWPVSAPQLCEVTQKAGLQELH